MEEKVNCEIIIGYLKDNNPVCDDCLSEKCNIFPRQQINSITTKLFKQKILRKEKNICSFCSKEKLVSSLIKNKEKEIKFKEENRKIPFPTNEEIEKYLMKWKTLENYTFQEKSLNKLFHITYPTNTEMDDVLIKVCSLNDFYSTNIFSSFNIAKHIVLLNIDKRLECGDLTLVNDIAKITIKDKERTFYSFATKYCSHHFDTKFPIFDSNGEKVLKYFNKVDNFFKFFDKDLKDYKKFYNILLEFRKFYKLDKYNFKEIDKYLWQLGKEYFPAKY